MTTIYLVRHGEVFNPDTIFYGRLPGYRLSENGEKQIDQTADFLKKKLITAIYASPIQRAQETAAIIQEKLQLPEIITSEGLTEVKTSYQGRPFSDLDALQSEIFLKPLSPTDETIEQIAHRMEGFIDHVINKYNEKQIVAVSHGGPIMILKGAIEGKPLAFEVFKTSDSYVKHGEIYQITIDEKGKKTIQSVFIPV